LNRGAQPGVGADPRRQGSRFVEISARKGAAGERKLAASAVLHTSEDLGDITIIALVEAPCGGSRSLTATSTPRLAAAPGAQGA
jgi:hypothetical protein